jgi:alkaline phosphatase D
MSKLLPQQGLLSTPGRRGFVIKLSALAAVMASGMAISANGEEGAQAPNLANPGREPEHTAAEAPAFDFGVASGDPLPDRVILWTHARRASALPVPLIWQVAHDAAFARIVASGKVLATAASDFTVKVDAVGLAADSEYFYRFIGGNRSISPVGRTRTLPAGRVDQVKLAVFSCSNYPAGYFNAYDAAVASGAQFALHLGDYIYEYEDGIYPKAAQSVAGRAPLPSRTTVTLQDYRSRHAQYKTDPYAKMLHARMPMMAIWDDHEFTNNAHLHGARNHDPHFHGTWTARRAAAAQAYQEWMPIRTPDAQNPLKIYRSFDFGDLLSLHMLDTRIIGREQQPDRALELDGSDIENTAFSPTGFDRSRQLLGQEQAAWLESKMQQSSAKWQVLGNQTVMARMLWPQSVLDANMGFAAMDAVLQARATPMQAQTGAQRRLLDPLHNPLLPSDFDNWEGYPDAREALLAQAQRLQQAGKEFLVLSGDSHNAWYNHLTLIDGTLVGAEFACPSVTSSGFEGYLLPEKVPPLQLAEKMRALVPEIQYLDTSRRGFMLVTLTREQAQCEFVYVSTVKSSSYQSSSEAVVYRGVVT